MEEFDWESHWDLDEIVHDGYVEECSTAYGIALRCFDKGYDTLSREQKEVYDLFVQPHMAKIGARREREERMRGMPN